MSTATAPAQPPRLERPGPAPGSPWLGRARPTVWRAFWTSRLVVLCAGVLAVLEIGRAPGTSGFDPANLTAPFGYFGNLLAAPFARWDSVWYLAIAQRGYAGQLARTAFFPLYPLLIRMLGTPIGSDLIAGVLISLAAFAVSLVLLYRLALLELGSERAEAAVMLLAFCPASYFFSAVYTESLFLALTLGCVLCARGGRWGWAGLLGGLAALSRNSGVVLIVPFALMFLYGPRTDVAPRPVSRRLAPRYPLTPAFAWILLIPAGLAVFLAYLGLSMHDWLAPFHAQGLWYRHFAGPFGGVWDGAVAAFDGLRQLLHGPRPPIYFAQAGGDPVTVAGQDLFLFGALLVGAVALVGTLRELPLAYGAYALVSLALPLSEPVGPQPLASLPRYEIVLFPLFLWAAGVLVRRRSTSAGLATAAVLLGLLTAEFATWRFVA